MTRIYTPDGWVIVKKEPDRFRVFCTWKDSWRISSQIDSVHYYEYPKYFLVTGISGSQYILYPEAEKRLGGYGTMMYNNIVGDVEQISMQQFLKEFLSSV